MSDEEDLLKQMLYDGKAVEMATIACTDPECGYVYMWMLDPEEQSWDDVPDYTECGRKEREVPDETDPRYGGPLYVHDPCEAPAKVFKDDAVLQQDDRTPEEIANEIFKREQREPQP